MDRPLDDRIVERQTRSRGPAPRRTRPSYPRDGVRKLQPATREDKANLENDWVHDRYDDEVSPNRSGYSRPRHGRDDYRDDRRSPEPDRTPVPAKLRVDNLHYDLTEEMIVDLFSRIAPVRDAKLTYDRAGRSEGVAFVTYDRIADAREAIREFDGANAKGQPIRLTLLPLPPRPARKDNPFERVTNPRSLFDRIEAPTRRNDRRRSDSPMSEVDDYSRNGSRRGAGGRDRRNNNNNNNNSSNNSRAAPENIDRYVPGQRDSSRRGGRRPGERRERRPEQTTSTRSGARPKKTAEQLDAEMDDYWGAQNAAGGDAAATTTTTTTTQTKTGSNSKPAQAATDDIDMIE